MIFVGHWPEPKSAKVFTRNNNNILFVVFTILC
jgi:hypothetical protein